MSTDPILLVAGEWLGAASGVLALVTITAFLLRWGVRFRLVGITSFTALLALSCLAFAVSYRPRVTVEGAVSVPVVFDNGAELVVAAAPADLAAAAATPSAEQVARNLRGNGRQSDDASVRVRLRRVDTVAPGLSQPVILAEVRRDLMTGEITAQP
jgi:hypothetical protein